MTSADGASRGAARVGRSLAVYAVVAVVGWWAVPWLRELLLLPALFVRLARWGLVVGAVAVAAVAWHYPRVGAAGARPPWERE